MSRFSPTSIACPRCGAAILAGLAESINVTRMPRARERILDGSFHRFDCPGCGEQVAVDCPFLYTDLRREHFVHVFPRAEEAGWPECEQIAGTTFHQGFLGAPPALQEAAHRYRVRAVFGLGALADKLRLWDAGLDDAVIELQKLELFVGAPELGPRGDVALEVTAVDERQLEVRASSLTGSWPALSFSLSRARHDQLLGRRDELLQRYPGLFHRPYVGYRRLARETVAAPGAAESPTTSTTGGER